MQVDLFLQLIFCSLRRLAVHLYLFNYPVEIQKRPHNFYTPEVKVLYSRNVTCCTRLPNGKKRKLLNKHISIITHLFIFVNYQIDNTPRFRTYVILHTYESIQSKLRVQT